MPMGAQGAPKHFHMTMGTILGTLPDTIKGHTRFYQDDIFVGGTNLGEAKLRARQVRNLLESYGFKINLVKSSAAPLTMVLGLLHDTDNAMIRLPSEKITNIARLTGIIQDAPPHIWREGDTSGRCSKCSRRL